MRVQLDYGKQGLEVELPDANVVGVLDLTPAPPVANGDAAVRAAIASPIGTRPLAEVAKGRRNACIVVCDITRPVPNHIILPPILDTLAQAGIGRERVTILIATGTHRPNIGAELDIILGPEIARSSHIVNHVCTDRDMLRRFRTTENGVPVWLNRTYTDADVKITVGLIEPHFMAGYSGGRKLVMPGIAGLETVQAWHSPRFLEHPNATNGIVEGNPVHDENTRIARLCPPDMMVDVTLDGEKRITGVFAGDMEAAWATGVEFVRRQVAATIPEPADIVITSGAGFPLDQTFYQAVKGMVGALPVARPGGDIIIAASCAEGIGGPDFTRTLLETQDLAELMTRMQSPGWEYVPDQWQVEELARAVRQNTVRLVCDGIAPGVAQNLFVAPALSVEDAVRAARDKHGADASIAVIPRGPYVIAGTSAPGPQLSA